MKLLLTSGGVTNPSIHAALVQLLGKPIAECHALVVPTAQWGHPMCGTLGPWVPWVRQADVPCPRRCGWESAPDLHDVSVRRRRCRARASR